MEVGGGGQVQRSRSGWDGPVSPPKVLSIVKFGVRPVCCLHFAQNFHIFLPSLMEKMPPKKCSSNRAKHAFFVFPKSSFPPKRAKYVISAKKLGNKLVERLKHITASKNSLCKEVFCHRFWP